MVKVNKKFLKFFFTKFYLVSTEFYHILLSFTSSGPKYDQIPLRTPVPAFAKPIFSCGCCMCVRLG